MDPEPPPDLDAVRASYDAVADNYVAMVGDPGPWHRAVLDAFAEQVRPVGPVLDAGCGPGWVTGYLHDRGVDIHGIDLSPRMIDHARRRHPDITFDVASVTEFRPDPWSLGGVLGWWSWFDLPRPWLPRIIATMAGALRPGGQLLMGMHCGDGDLRRTRCYGDVPVDWTSHLYQPDELAGLVEDAGLRRTVELRVPSPEASVPPGVIVCAKNPAG
ncbi:class I SAM-dependent DNA methyltransferase [Williamsia deligens]|uniref:Class I SAM-dependent DNA methyltransferase n=1 Tax=Williamsia deligens TaxID=321325 RepID=A0ABW3GAK9_9NOCA|nr:class I SAM-dependent methyltransferase [Williamsia deligens]